MELADHDSNINMVHNEPYPHKGILAVHDQHIRALLNVTIIK